MEYRRRIIASSPHLSHAEGAVASFVDGTDLPLKSLVIDIEPLQSGTGDPSPSNIRPISGWDAVGVHNGNTVVTTISLGRTVYGGTLNVLSGELVVDRAMVDLGTLNWAKSNNRGGYFWVDIPLRKIGSDLSSSIYQYHGYRPATYVGANVGLYEETTTSDRYIDIYDPSCANVTELKTAINGQQLVYELATSLTYHLDPQTVRSLVGQNNIFSDTGNVALDYWAHP